MKTDIFQGVQRQSSNSQCLSKESFAKLSEMMYEQKFPARTYLFWEGDAANKLYFIKQGRVKITKTTDDGRQLILYMYQEGDLFGQVDCFNDSKHSFSAVVLEESTLGVIAQDELELLLWQHGELAVEFMKWMGLMHRTTQTKFRDLLMFGKPGALCSTLIRLGNSYGTSMGDSIYIEKKITNSELGEMIGATRECVNRMLGDLKKAKAIAFDNGHIVIKNLQYLRDICQCENCPINICRI